MRPFGERYDSLFNIGLKYRHEIVGREVVVEEYVVDPYQQVIFNPFAHVTRFIAEYGTYRKHVTRIAVYAWPTHGKHASVEHIYRRRDYVSFYRYLHCLVHGRGCLRIWFNITLRSSLVMPNR